MTAKRTIIGILFAGLLAPVAAHAQLGDFVNKLTGGGKPNELNPTKVIACFRLEGPLAETPTSIPPLLGGKPPLSLLELLERLKEARQDKSVTAVVMDVQNAQLGIGQWEEIHESIRKFEAVDKQVFVHADRLTTLTYAAATAASHISVVPTGDIWLTGLYSETPYLRGMLDKIGVVPDVEQCGNFKTGGEFITRKEPSEESKKMTKWLLDGLFDSMVERMAKSRKTTPLKLKGLIDNGPYSAEDALKAGLVDSVRYRQDFIKDLKTRYGQAIKFVADYGETDGDEIPQDFFAMMNWMMEMLNPSPKEYTEPSVAIVYVDGMIQEGAVEPSPFGTPEGAFSTTIRKALDEAADDGSVKAVVLRVDSPGGSALASEIIWNATQRVAAKKPFVVSMGNVAGSGGYYVSCGAETIFADHTTITASIGVLSGKLVTTGGWEIYWRGRCWSPPGP
ncbi:MAG: S49 family peptidase, partial [Planctomycetota bacterium]